jgi:hypothetical protein
MWYYLVNEFAPRCTAFVRVMFPLHAKASTEDRRDITVGPVFPDIASYQGKATPCSIRRVRFAPSLVLHLASLRGKRVLPAIESGEYVEIQGRNVLLSDIPKT